MNERCTKMNKWRDENGNVYTVEQSARNKRFLVIRTNPGGNRKAARVVPASGALRMCKKNWMNTPRRAAGRRCRHESERT